MILQSENSIYMFYEIIEQLEPQDVLDVGMFLKRVGAVSRKIMDREVQQDCRLHGVDFFPETAFPVWNTIYDEIIYVEQYISGLNRKHYDLSVVFGIDAMQKKASLEKIVFETANSSKYILLDEWLPVWGQQNRFKRAIDIKVENTIYFLAEFKD